MTDSESQSQTDADRRFSATRRGFIGALVAGGITGTALTPLGEMFDRIAPLSGQTWRAVGRVPETVESPYGEATLTRDEYGVPHVEADTEDAAYFALGYAQAADRLAQMDLQRRRARGTLAAVAGPEFVDEDVFHRKLDLDTAATTSEQAMAGSRTERLLERYAAGINAFIDHGDPGLAVGLLGYEPREWTVHDSVLVLLGTAWLFSGGFDPVWRSVTRRTFDEERHETLYPQQYDHDAPIIRDEPTRQTDRHRQRGESVAPALVDWLNTFEPPEFIGSNAWTVAGSHTETGEPILASDPHVLLQAPTTFYEQQVAADGATVRGITVPGLPFVVVGENDHGAWGITNAGGVNVVDCYTYETEGDRYRYRDDWLAFDSRTETIAVAYGDDRDVTVRKTVHGAFLDPEVDGDDRHVGVAWPGLGGARDLQALYELNTSSDVTAFEDAVRRIDAIPLNVHYAGRDGSTRYQLVGKIPVRRVDGDPVPGDRVFDGSAGEAEWDGFEPYGESTWDGFVPFDELPSVRDRAVIASANQRIADDHPYPIEQPNVGGYRAVRIYERLDEAVEADAAIDRDFVASVQLDTYSKRAEKLVPRLLEARGQMPDGATPWLDALSEWEYRMDRDSRAALVFRHCLRQFRALTWSPLFEDHGLGRRYWPDDRVLLDLPADSEHFDGDRAAVLADAMARAIDDIEEAGWETYGEFNVTAIDHPLGDLEPGLNYDRYPTDGAGQTVRAVSTTANWGAGYRMICDLGGESIGVLAGGTDGTPTADHYQDQLRMWADGEYRRLRPSDPSGTVLVFEGTDQ